MPKTVAFTGPRPEKLPYALGDVAAVDRLGNVLEEQIISAINRGYTRFFSGMSRGVDLIAADRVLMLRERGCDVALIAAIPYRGQPDEWGDEDRAEHARILGLCDGQEILSEMFTARCYNCRNRYMVERADLLMAIYDGHSGGGTENTLDFAVQKGIPIVLIHPGTLVITHLTRDL